MSSFGDNFKKGLKSAFEKPSVYLPAQNDIPFLLKASGIYPSHEKCDVDHQYTNLPYKRCNFIMALQLDHFVFNLLLKSFTIPECGVGWGMAEDSSFFPTPYVDVKSISIEAYFHKNFKGTLYELYNRQFSNGLLNLKNLRFNAFIKTMSYHESAQIKQSKGDQLASIAKTIEGAVSTARDSTVSTISSLSSMLSEAIDTVQDIKIRAKSELFYKEMGETLCSLKGCCLNAPTFEPDPASNDLATIKANISYISARFNELK